MSDTTRDRIPDDDPSPFSCFSRLASDEEASAAVEFIILIPIYVLLLGGLFMISNLALIRSALVQANRFQAWAPQEPSTYAGLQNGDSFFGPYNGTFNLNPDPSIGVERKKTAVTYKNANAAAASLPSVTGFSRSSQSQTLAADALNNIGSGGTADQALWRVEAAASYEYNGVRLLGLGPITQITRCVVLLPREHTREEFKKDDQGDPHPVLHWRLGGATVKSKFDPTQAKNMPLSPFYTAGGMFTRKIGSSGARDDGIWDRATSTHDGARIKGDIDSEQRYYNDPSKPKK